MPVDFVGQVDQMIAANLASGEASIARIAMLLRVSRRTLQRSLEQKGTNFSERLDAARRRVVDDYFRTEKRPNLTLLAYRLGYSDASAASRFLRTHMDIGVCSSPRASRTAAPSRARSAAKQAEGLARSPPTGSEPTPAPPPDERRGGKK